MPPPAAGSIGGGSRASAASAPEAFHPSIAVKEYNAVRLNCQTVYPRPLTTQNHPAQDIRAGTHPTACGSPPPPGQAGSVNRSGTGRLTTECADSCAPPSYPSPATALSPTHLSSPG